MKRLFGIALVASGLALGPIQAQEVDPSRGTTPGYGTPMNTDRDFDLGWLGLIGLAGLAGLVRKRDRYDNIDRTTSTTNRM